MTNLIKKGLNYLTDSHYRFFINIKLGKYDQLPDEEFIKLYWNNFFQGNKKLNLETPQTLCEKLQWLKLYYRKPIFTTMVDKYGVKKFVADKIGEKYVIPTIGVWDKVEDIDFKSLPNQFVLKPTHDSGGLVICRNKSNLNIIDIKEKLRKSLQRNYFIGKREWPYKHVPRRIIAEPLIEQLGRPDSVEYKTTCFNGKVAFVTICKGIAHARFEDRSNDHFDRDFNKLNWYVNYKPAAVTPTKPKQWDELLLICEKLAEGVPYLRVDTYIVDGRIFFGEMTFFTWAGFMHFVPEEWDLKLGQMLMLPKEKCMME